MWGGGGGISNSGFRMIYGGIALIAALGLLLVFLGYRLIPLAPFELWLHSTMGLSQPVLWIVSRMPGLLVSATGAVVFIVPAKWLVDYARG